MYVFDDVLPGNFQVEVPALPFLSGGESPQSIAVTRSPSDGDTTVATTMGRLRPEFVSIRDWLGSAPRERLLVAVEAGSSSLLTEASPSTSSVTSPQVSLDAAGDNLTITGSNSDGDEVEATVSVSDGDQVQERGRFGDLRLLRVNVEPDVVTFEATSSATSTPEGELVSAEADTPSVAAAATEDAPVESSTAVDDSSGSLTVDGIAEGESVASTPIASAVTQADVFVPAMRESSDAEPEEPETLESADADSVTGSVDQAVQDVAETLTLISGTEDVIAGADESGIDGASVDQVLTTNLRRRRFFS